VIAKGLTARTLNKSKGDDGVAEEVESGRIHLAYPESGWMNQVVAIEYLTWLAVILQPEKGQNKGIRKIDGLTYGAARLYSLVLRPPNRALNFFHPFSGLLWGAMAAGSTRKTAGSTGAGDSAGTPAISKSWLGRCASAPAPAALDAPLGARARNARGAQGARGSAGARVRAPEPQPEVPINLPASPTAWTTPSRRHRASP